MSVMNVAKSISRISGMPSRRPICILRVIDGPGRSNACPSEGQSTTWSASSTPPVFGFVPSGSYRCYRNRLAGQAPTGNKCNHGGARMRTALLGSKWRCRARERVR